MSQASVTANMALGIALVFWSSSSLATRKNCPKAVSTNNTCLHRVYTIIDWDIIPRTAEKNLKSESTVYFVLAT